VEVKERGRKRGGADIKTKCSRKVKEDRRRGRRIRSEGQEGR
jgi:hypothetical protein